MRNAVSIAWMRASSAGVAAALGARAPRCSWRSRSSCRRWAVERQRAVAQVGDHLRRVEVGVVDVGALVLARQEAARPQLGEAHRPAGAEDDVAGQVGVLACPGRSDSHAPRLGRVGVIVPLFIRNRAGPWLGLSVCSERRTHRSSACAAQVRQQLADLQAALAALARSVNGTGIRPPVWFSVRSSTAFGPLAGVLVDGRLGVEQVGRTGRRS